MGNRTEGSSEAAQLPGAGRVGRLLVATRALGRALLRTPRRWAWPAPLAWAALIWFSSSLVPDVSVGRGRGFAALVNLGHAFEFGVLVLLLVPLAPRRAGTPLAGSRAAAKGVEGPWVELEPEVITALAAVAIAYGVADEVHQAFVAGRHSSPLDLLTDAVGVFCTLKVVAYVSSPRATGRGLAGQLVRGLVLCALAAGIATLGRS